jgi:hypothetical protein
MDNVGAGPPTATEMSVGDMLKHHEARSQERYVNLMKHVADHFDNFSGSVKFHAGKDGEHHMGKAEEIHVHNVGSGDGGNGGLGLAALAALSNRGQGNDMAPLALASLMHRSGNDDGRRGGYGYGDCGLGAGAGGLAGAALGFVAGALVNGGRRGGGLFGGGDDCGNGGAETRIEDTVFNTAVLSKLGSLEAIVPTSALQTQIAINQSIDQAALTTLGAISNVKDSVVGVKDSVQGATQFLSGQIQAGKDAVQNLALYLTQQINTVNQNVSEQGCATRAEVGRTTTLILERINANTIAELQAELAEARHVGRGHASDLTVTQTVNQVQAQAQQQQQTQAILGVLNGIACGLGNLTQIAHATNSNIIAGNTGAVTTAAQTASPTNVGRV